MKLVEAKKLYTTTRPRQRLLHLAINQRDASDHELKRFVDRLRTFLGEKKTK